MPAAAETAQQIPTARSARPAPRSSHVAGPELLPESRLMSHRDAQRSPDPAARLAAETLSAVVALVPSRLAIFWSITPRSEIGDAVVLENATQQPGTPIDPGFYRPRVRSVDPFAPSRAARTGASLLTVEDAGGALRFANSAYGRQLHRAGVEHQVTLYLRAAGGLRAMVVLYRAYGSLAFEPGEIRVLRHLQPLLEQAYACSLRSNAAVELPSTLPALTRREREVAALIASGASNAEIAIALNVEQSTVKAHLNQIYAKYGLRSRTQLALRLNREAHPLGVSNLS